MGSCDNMCDLLRRDLIFRKYTVTVNSMIKGPKYALRAANHLATDRPARGWAHRYDPLTAPYYYPFSVPMIMELT
jgi:hypothetical protein